MRKPELRSWTRGASGRGLSWILASIVLMATVALDSRAHTPHDRIVVRNTLLRWSAGVANADADLVAGILADDFQHQTFFGAPEMREGYLAKVAGGEAPMQRIDTRYASYEIEESMARAHSVVGVVMETTRIAVDVELVRRDGVWRIRRVEQRAALPSQLERRFPEQQDLHAVTIRVVDAGSGKPLASRVHVEDATGRYWPPVGHRGPVPKGWRQDVGSDVLVEGKTFAYVGGEFELRLAVGSYRIDVVRGFETHPRSLDFKVSGSQRSELRVELERWSEVARQGWYSGDTHVHFLDPYDGLLESRGEDLNVVNVLATKWGELITNLEHFSGEPSVVSDAEHIVYVGEESRHGFLGHTILLGISRLVFPLSWGAPSEGVPNGIDHPPMAHQADEAHRRGGFVSWAHFPWPDGELAIDVALGKIDSVDLFTWGDAFSDHNVMPAPPAALTWYRFLNCGFKLPVTAGTDKMSNDQVTGSVRTYVKLDGPLTYDGWLDGIRAGRTFVTTAPMMDLRVDGQPIGSTLAVARGAKLKLHASANSRLPVEVIEIIQDGAVVARSENRERSIDFDLETEISVDGSSWIAARSWSSQTIPVQKLAVAGFDGIPVMAHTSPIYLDVDGAPRRSPEDARVLLGRVDRAIEWAEQQARVANPSQRREMLELFRRARAIYSEQLAH